MTKNTDKLNSLVSIIIPVYNVEEYLEECLNSVISQTYKNLEIFLIDDGSKDSSPDICDEFSKKDNRITVIHKENGGLSSARNFALDLCKGEYIYFLDSDDIIKEKAIEYMVNTIELHNSDVVFSKFLRFSEDIPTFSENYKSFVLNTNDAVSKMLTHKWPGHEACGKLYRKQLWSDIRFPFGKLYEDYQTTYKILSKCDKVSLCDMSLYLYRTRLGSIMNSSIKKKELTIIPISQEVTNFINQQFPKLGHKAIYLQTITYLKFYYRIMCEDDKLFVDETVQLRSFINRQWWLLFKLWVPLKDKVKIISFYINKKIFKYLYAKAAK